jgi:hypothetical protein
MDDSAKKSGLIGAVIITVTTGVLINVLTDWFKPWTSFGSDPPANKAAAAPALPPAGPKAVGAPVEKRDKTLESKSITIPDTEDD